MTCHGILACSSEEVDDDGDTTDTDAAPSSALVVARRPKSSFDGTQRDNVFHMPLSLQADQELFPPVGSLLGVRKLKSEELNSADGICELSAMCQRQ